MVGGVKDQVGGGYCHFYFWWSEVILIFQEEKSGCFFLLILIFYLPSLCNVLYKASPTDSFHFPLCVITVNEWPFFLVWTNVDLMCECETVVASITESRPIRQNKCCHCLFLQTTGLLNLYISVCCNFTFIYSQFSISCYGNTLPMLWFSLGTKTTWLG